MFILFNNILQHIQEMNRTRLELYEEIVTDALKSYSFRKLDFHFNTSLAAVNLIKAHARNGKKHDNLSKHNSLISDKYSITITYINLILTQIQSPIFQL